MRHWNDVDRDEYNKACQEAWEFSDRQPERIDRMVEVIRDAVQAQRRWACDIHQDALRNGLGGKLNTWSKNRNKVAVAYNGQVLSKPRTIGTQKRSDDGETYVTPTLFDYMPWDELIAKRYEYVRQRMAYDADISLMDRLLALRDMAEDAKTPAEAVVQLGITIEEYLGEVAS